MHAGGDASRPGETPASVSVRNRKKNRIEPARKEELFGADGKICIINENCYYVRVRNCSASESTFSRCSKT